MIQFNEVFLKTSDFNINISDNEIINSMRNKIFWRVLWNSRKKFNLQYILMVENIVKSFPKNYENKNRIFIIDYQ